jgi:hypothetical protein
VSLARADPLRVAIELDGPTALELTRAIAAELPSGLRAVDANAELVIAGHVDSHRHGRTLALRALSKASATQSVRIAIPHKIDRHRLAKLLSARLPSLLAPLLDEHKAPAPIATRSEPQPIPETTAIKAEPDRPKDPPIPVAAVERARPEPTAMPVIALWLDGGIGARRFTYNQPISANLAGFTIPAVPLIDLGLELWPFARTRPRALRGLGVVARFGRSLHAESLVSGATTRVQSTWTYVDAGLREQLTLTRGRTAVVLGVALTAGGTWFSFDGDTGALAAQLPAVRDVHVRPGAEVRVAIGRIALAAQFGYRAILSTGDFDARFPHESVGGIDAQLSIAILLGKGFAVRASGEYVRVFYDFRPRPGDAYVAGGALDEYALGQLGLAWSL